MKLTVTRSLLALTMLALFTGPAGAQDESGGSARVSDSPAPTPSSAAPVYVAPDPGVGPFFPITPVETWFAPRTYVNTRAGNLYGYEESFTNLGGFVPYFFEENAMLFADARGLVTYDGRGGANLGVGWRYFMPQHDRFIGLSAWYDFDAGHIRSYNQLGLGFESIGRYMDLRLNGYIPVGNDQNVLSSTLAGPGQFSGNNLFLSRINEIETAFTGFDSEIGGPMPILGRYGLSGYVGFYFFTGSSGSDFTGVSGRLNWQVNEDWQIGVQSTDDHVFGTNAQLQVSVNLPDGKAGRWLRPLSVRDRMMQSVVRNDRVTVEHEYQIRDELAINPKTNQPYFVVHVDPNGADGAVTGTGSFEDPYNQLAQFDNLPFAEKSLVNIIYVDPRTDGTSINLDDGVTLLSMQRLLSSSLTHQFQIAQFPGVNFELPNAQLGQPLPVLSNTTGGNVVTFADGAMMLEVSGFEINGSATGSGIFGTNNQGVSINRNVIQNGLNGISLFNLSGLEAEGMAGIIDRNIIRNNVIDGINISNSGAPPLDLFITRNHPTDIDLDGEITVDVPGDDPNDDTNGDGVADTSVADLASPDSLDGDGDFSNDGILMNGDDGVDINADAGSVINLVMLQNRIGGQLVDVTTGGVTPAGNGDNGVEIDATAGSTIRATIQDHVPVAVTTLFDDGQGNVIDVTLFTADYRIGFNGDNGIAVSSNNSVVDMLTTGGIRNNLINGNGQTTGVNGDGIDIVSTGNSTFSLGVFGNTIGAPLVRNTTNVDITDPTLGNAGIGLRFFANSGSSLLAIGDPAVQVNPDDIDLAGFSNDFSFNAVSGIDISATGNALVSFNIDSNRIRNVITAPTPPPLAALSFTLDGSTATNPFVVTNLSDPGIDIVSLLWNVAPTGVSFDTNNVALNNLAAFQPVAPVGGGNQSDLTTGLTQVNNTVIVPGTNPLNDVFGTLVDATDIPDSSTLLSLNFNDFDPTEQLAARIRLAQDPQSIARNDAAAGGAAAAGSTVTATFSNGLQVNFNLALTSATGVTGTGQVFGAPTAGFGSGQDGIHVAASGNATLNPAIIQNNLVEGYREHGIHVEATDLADIPNLVIHNNTLRFNGDGGDPTLPREPSGVALEISRNGSADINAVVTNNMINSNFNDGFQMTSQGTVVGGLFVNSADNQITANGGDGVVLFAGGNARLSWDSTRDVITGNQGDNINGLIDENAIVTINLENIIATNAGGDGFDLTLDGTSSLLINISSPDDPLFMGTQSTFSGNGGDGFRLTTRARSLGTVNVDETLFDNNGGDGFSLDRQDTSLILAVMQNSSASSNDDDGIQFYATGSDRADPNTPLFNNATLLAPANRLVLNNVIVDDNGVSTSPNGGNGLETATFADAVLIVNASSSSFSNNFMDGVRSFSTGQSSFGEANDRVTFDNVTINDNGKRGNLNNHGDGIRLFAMGTFSAMPTQFVQVSSVNGLTTISGNADDGIQASMPFGSIDLLVTGQAGVDFTTLIQDNGFGAGTTPSATGHGIEFNVADSAVDGDDASDIPGANVRVDGDAGGGANEILDFFLPNGFEFDSTPAGFSGIGVLTVQNVSVGDDNLTDVFAHGNAGDGISVFVSNIENFHGTHANGAVSTFNGNNAGNFMDVNRDLIADNAAGRGGTASAATFDLVSQAGRVDLVIDNTQLSGNGRDGLNITSDGDNQTFDPGNIINATVTNNLISENGRHGVNLDLEGRHGETNALNAIFSGGAISYQVLTTNQFIFDNNVIERNNNYGFRMQQNAGAQRRLNFGNLADSYFWSEQFQDGIQPTNPPGLFDPIVLAGISSTTPIWNFGNNDDGFALSTTYYAIATDLNSNLVFNNNTVQFNGQPSQNFDFGPNGGGDGMFIRNSTNSFLSADIGGQAGSGNGNTFTGNALADIRFESFAATEVDGITPMVANVSTAAAAPTNDQLFFDDTAQLTLRFNNNIGREVDANYIIVGNGATVGQRGAAYNVNGSPFIGGANLLRATQMFQVDDGFNLNVTNTFNTDLSTEFQFSGGWHLVPVADPAFPNPTFPQDVIEDFSNPWFLP
jgi:hypothetical protein